MNHLALEVAGQEDLRRAKEKLEAAGIPVLGVTDHHFIESIYFFDPNGIRLELTTVTGKIDYKAAKLNSSPFGPLQRSVLILCALIAMMDGFDTQAIAYVAPVIAAHWNLSISSFGPIFGAGLFGLMIGALVVGPAADTPLINWSMSIRCAS